MHPSFSFKKQLWKRLKKNKGALFGLLIIIISFFVAVFGYLIAPDNTPSADLQTVEIQAKKPGYTQRFLKIYTTGNNEQNWLHILLYGKTPDYKLIPVSGMVKNYCRN
jgi:ABC-type antimicrobial peptide transport system permease subunit